MCFNNPTSLSVNTSFVWREGNGFRSNYVYHSRCHRERPPFSGAGCVRVASLRKSFELFERELTWWLFDG